VGYQAPAGAGKFVEHGVAGLETEVVDEKVNNLEGYRVELELDILHTSHIPAFPCPGPGVDLLWK